VIHQDKVTAAESAADQYVKAAKKQYKRKPVMVAAVSVPATDSLAAE